MSLVRWTLLASILLLGCGGENQAPSLALLTDQTVVVGETLRFIVTGDDPDGDRLSFDIDGLPKEAQLTPRAKEEAVIVWSPLITDTQPGGRRYEVTISAEDGRGGSARQTVGVVVYPTFGYPTFTLPAGVVLNLAEDDDLALLVEVKDDDSTSVNLELAEGPEGAKLQPADTAKQAYFYWKPDDLQRTVAVHRAIFRATDESHGPVTHTLTIVLLNAEKQSGCEGTPPNVVHANPPDENIDGDFALNVTASDGQSQVESMTLHWTAGDPNGSYASAPFERDDPNGDTWTSHVALNPDSDGTLVAYYITATDNDDPTGIACDREGRYPKSGYFLAAVYPDGTSSATCVDRGEPDSTPEDAPTHGAGTYPGNRLCGDDYDYVHVEAAADATVVASIAWNPAQGELDLALVDAAGTRLESSTPVGEGRLTVSHHLGDGEQVFVEVGSVSIGARVSYTLELATEATQCSDDAAEDDSTIDGARAIGVGGEVSQKICPGDSDYFSLSAGPDSPVRITVAFDHQYGDLDVDVLAADGTTVVAQSATEQSLETIELVPDTSGTYFVRVYGIEGATNGYTLTVDDASGALCTADGLGDNTSPERASVLFQGVYEGFVSCAAQPDWFVLDVNGGETLDILTLSETTPVTIEVYEDITSSPVASATTDGSGFAETQYVRTTAGSIYYTVEPQGETATYSLLQQLTDPPGGCQDDRLEPNSSSLPKPIEPGVTTWLRMCGQADTDAFTIEVEAFTTLVVLTAHDRGEQFTDLQILGPDGSVRWSADDSGDGAYIEEVAEEAGTYTVVVRPFDVTADGLGYDLAIFLD